MYRDDIPRWIEEVHERTSVSDERVLGHVRATGVARTYVGARKLAQALIDGRPTRIDEGEWDVAPDASWGSWIEGVPFLHAAMLNRDIVVDLVPSPDEQAFRKNYRCSSQQFLTILRRLTDLNQRRVFINIRDYNPYARDRDDDGLTKYTNSHEVLGKIFFALKSNDFLGVYVNAVRRESLFAGLIGKGALEETYRKVQALLEAPLVQFLAEVGKGRTFPQMLVRGGQAPPAAQLIWRVAYHLAFARAIPEGIKLDGRLAEMLSKAEKGTVPTPADLTEIIQRATMLHHKYTAPLTGAYGGTYNLDEAEFHGSDLVASYSPIGAQRVRTGAGFLEVMYRLVQGDLRVQKPGIFKDVLVENAPVTITQEGDIPSQNEISAFFDNMEPMQEWLRRQAKIRARLAALAAKAGDSRNLTAGQVQDLINQDLKANRGLFANYKKHFASVGIVGVIGGLTGLASSFGGAGSAGVTLAGAAAATTMAPITLVIAAATLAGLPFIQEMAKDRVCGALCTMDDVKQVWQLYSPKRG